MKIVEQYLQFVTKHNENDRLMFRKNKQANYLSRQCNKFEISSKSKVYSSLEYVQSLQYKQNEKE